MKIAHEVREYALSQRVSEPEALKKSTAQKALEFARRGAKRDREV
ncbi:MAG: hypothetical protein AABY65_11555 [Nitrospirota bacterium]